MRVKKVSDRIRVKRIPSRGHYDRETINSILDAAFICHIGFVAEGQPYVIPTSYGREGDAVYFHGSAASRMLKAIAGGLDICLTVTIIDGLVLARSAFHHSMNYRSAVILGKAEPLIGDAEKERALEVISEQIIPGRWKDVRLPTQKELKATTVMRMKLDEASAKIRTGPPVDDKEDYSLGVWAGVVPLEMSSGQPIADPLLHTSIEVPAYIREYRP